MEPKSKRRRLRFIWPMLITFILCDLLLYFTKADISKINDNDFLFTFTGVLLGFAITIFPFIVTLVDKIKEKGKEKHNNDGNKKSKIQNSITALYNEVKDDIVFVFISLVIVSSIYILEKFKPVTASYWIANFFEKELAWKSLRLSIFVLNIYAIYDLIVVSFKLSDSTGILEISASSDIKSNS